LTEKTPTPGGFALAGQNASNWKIQCKTEIRNNALPVETVVNELAAQVGCKPAGVWNACECFEETGLDVLYNGYRSSVDAN
jgi:hypothetical protein